MEERDAKQTEGCEGATDASASRGGSERVQGSDKILDELSDVMAPGDSVLIGGGQKATLIDLFKEKKSIFVGRMARRFEIKVSSAES
jgi:hypothetical protein